MSKKPAKTPAERRSREARNLGYTLIAGGVVTAPFFLIPSDYFGIYPRLVFLTLSGVVIWLGRKIARGENL